MESKVNFAVVGAFVVLLGAALIGGVLWLSSGAHYGQTYAMYLTYMSDSVAGLNLNAPVKYRGVDVGFVKRIELDPANVEQVRLTLAIAQGTPVKVDTVAVLQTQGLTGIAYVQLTAGGRNSPVLEARAGEDYPVIASGPSMLTRLDSAVAKALASLTSATDNFNALMNADNRRSVSQALADLAVLSRTLAARSPAIDASLADLARTSANAARVSGELPQLLQRIDRSADAFDRMSDAVAGAGRSAASAVEGTRADVQRFSDETLPELRRLVEELRQLTGTLQRVGAEIERNPSLLLRGKPAAKRGPGE